MRVRHNFHFLFSVCALAVAAPALAPHSLRASVSPSRPPPSHPVAIAAVEVTDVVPIFSISKAETSSHF
ncbi:HAD family hydrolase [Sesbania bispinosa]|nr:HAD family hydrolase [Sesbania bispinosa]